MALAAVLGALLCLATRYDKLTVVFRGGALVCSIFIWATAL